MDILFKNRFMTLWDKYFGKAEMPMAFYYTDEDTEGNLVEFKQQGKGFQCFIGHLNRVMQGEDLRFNAKSFGCPGGLAYAGFRELAMPGFEYFLSCGIEGKMEGERYKRTPELAKGYKNNLPHFKAPAKNLVFKRWDRLTESDLPEAVVFFAAPDVLSGLFTLSNFEEGGLTNVEVPFSSGCGAIVMWPSVERLRGSQKSFMGLFDVSARSEVPSGVLSFAIPFEKFENMVNCMEESFLTTKSWDKVKQRIEA